MGGSAFPNLEISRIPSETLPELLSHITTLLSPYYKIRVPPPAPDKRDHGDLDLLVLPLTPPPDLKPLLSFIASAKNRNSPTTSFAVPFPFSLSPSPGALFQLDLHECGSEQELQWIRFLRSYGVFWSIVAAMARKVGLRIDDRGLHLRMEGEGRRLCLTQTPSEVLGFFFGGDGYGEWDGLEEMFAFLKGCRFFSKEAFEGENESAKDRQRGWKREGWVRWMESLEGLPDGEGRVVEKEEEVRREALVRFGKLAEYEEMLRERHKRVSEKNMWREVMEGLPLETVREKGLTVRRLRRLWESEAGRDVEAIPEFVETHWKQEWLKAMEQDAQASSKHKSKGKGDENRVVVSL
jgi:hypothetical protein